MVKVVKTKVLYSILSKKKKKKSYILFEPKFFSTIESSYVIELQNSIRLYSIIINMGDEIFFGRKYE